MHHYSRASNVRLEHKIMGNVPPYERRFRTTPVLEEYAGEVSVARMLDGLERHARPTGFKLHAIPDLAVELLEHDFPPELVDPRTIIPIQPPESPMVA